MRIDVTRVRLKNMIYHLEPIDSTLLLEYYNTCMSTEHYKYPAYILFDLITP